MCVRVITPKIGAQLPMAGRDLQPAAVLPVAQARTQRREEGGWERRALDRFLQFLGRSLFLNSYGNREWAIVCIYADFIKNEEAWHNYPNICLKIVLT